MKLSILIPTTEDREKFNTRILFELNRQKSQYQRNEVELLWDFGTETTGFKRNRLVNTAKGEYTCFVDSDDMITDIYIKKQMDVVNSGMDCGSLNGLYFCNGIYDRPFTHSIKYKSWFTEREAYRRCPNHLNAVKRGIALQIPFPDKIVGEDGVQSMDMLASGLIKSEYEIKETLYLYYDRTK